MPRSRLRPFFDARTSGYWLAGAHAHVFQRWLWWSVIQGRPMQQHTLDDFFKAPDLLTPPDVSGWGHV